MRADSEAALFYRRAQLPARALLIATGALLCSAARGDSTAGVVQPLDLKPGFWEILLHVATSGVIPRLPPESIQALTASMSAEQRRKFLADLEAREERTEQEAQQGRDRTGMVCPLRQEFETRIEARRQADHCTKTIRSTGQELHLQLLCPALGGFPATEQDSNFERIDPEHFRGTIPVITRGEQTVTMTETYLGHWRAEACPNSRPIRAAQSGIRPGAPERPPSQDLSRVVALIDGAPISARAGMDLIGSAPPSMRQRYQGRLPELLQRLYMQNAIIAEAVRLHLDRKPPWDAQLQNTTKLLASAPNDPGEGPIPPALMVQWQNARGRILWEAFFGQAASLPERQALFEQQQQKYRISVQDPDFFIGLDAP
jgi:hypothetical protein